MTQQISMSRFFSLLRWLSTYESRKLWNLFLIAIVFFAGYETYAMYYNIDARASEGVPLSAGVVMRMIEKTNGICLLALTLFMCIGATFAFTTLHRRHAGRQLLMLPAPNVEKFLALWVVYVPVLFVCLVLAFVVGDLMRMLILPLLTEQGHLPSSIPSFFSRMWYWIALRETVPANLQFMMESWTLILTIHALSLFCSVLAGYAGWLLMGVTVYVGTYLFINSYGQASWHVPFLLMLAVVLLLMAYRLFRSYTPSQLLNMLRFHGIQFR